MIQKITLKKIEKERAYFKDEKNNEIILPETYIDKGMVEGDELFLNISSTEVASKEIINELLDI